MTRARLMSSSLVLVLAACSGGPKPPATAIPPANQPTLPGVGGETYGALSYGGDEYGPRDPEPEPEPAAPPSPPVIVGTWKSTCLPGTSAGTSTRLTFELTDAAWTLSDDWFGDAACSKHTGVVHLAGAYTIGAPSPTVANAWDGTFTFTRRDLVADDAKTAKTMAKLCGVKSVKAKKAVDLSAGCAGMNMKPIGECSADHDLVAIVGSELQFGVRPADNDMCTADKRPTALETKLALVYQAPATGIAECDQYMQAVVGVMGCPKLPFAAKSAMLDAMRQSVGALASTPPDQREAAAAACAQASEALRAGLVTFGC